MSNATRKPRSTKPAGQGPTQMNRHDLWLAKQVRQIMEAEDRIEPRHTGDPTDALPDFDDGELELGRYVSPATEAKRWIR